MTTISPAIFFAHGNPMNALADNAYTAAWAAIGRSMPRPQAVLMVSAHWYIPHCAVTANRHPPTIHDFGGFPEELYRVSYPAPGSLELAKRVQALLAPAPAPVSVALDGDWGLDHGTWSVLKHVFPDADVPVVQLAIDRTRPPAFHYQLGRRLGALREEGVLVAGSGNIVHNLSAYAWGRPDVQAYDWAARFEAQVREAVSDGDDAALVEYHVLGPEAALSAPTPEHYLPLLYVLGARRDGDRVSFPAEGMEGGSISMLTVRLGS